MADPIKRAVLALLKVPPEPAPPAGAPGSLRIFRASVKWYRLRVALWAIKQALAIVGILIFLAIPWGRISFPLPGELQNLARRFGIEGTGAPREGGAGVTITWGDLEGILTWIEALGIGLLALQAGGSWALLKIDWEMRWFMTTDRSLRVREGCWRVRERTLTLANVQNVAVEQNPIQRLLGIADVKVRTAGGGDRAASEGRHGHDAEDDLLHVAILRHVDDADSIRDLILDRLRRAKDTGLGDPEDRGAVSSSRLAVAAAQEVLFEARELRAVLERRN